MRTEDNTSKPGGTLPPPAILAPAGDRQAFLAAIAAGADAVYCGLKRFSARMAASNFSIDELADLSELAHAQGVGVCVALNSLLKPDEVEETADLLRSLRDRVRPLALIVQDLACLHLIRRLGIPSQVHLSTLANVSFTRALMPLRRWLKVDRVVLPRELDVDEIQAMARACPAGLGLEVFVHGALCYGVSGRCYWSSYLGGKSGLRGRCVQPCRRLYTQGQAQRRFFACRDLHLDALVRVLQKIPQVRAWKIEGRKKGAHYVYYTVSAYRLLRDEGRDPRQRKTALALLEQALGRPGTHFHFLPQRRYSPVDAGGQTGSGRLVGRVRRGRGKAHIAAHHQLLAGDVLRIGYEDMRGHAVVRVGRFVPRGGRWHLPPEVRGHAARGAPVFLIDRREKELVERLAALDKRVRPHLPTSSPRTPPSVAACRRKRSGGRSRDLNVYRRRRGHSQKDPVGYWLPAATRSRREPGFWSRVWWWLPPVVWPSEEDRLHARIRRLTAKGGRRFVLNAPWQCGLFTGARGLRLWAGPFCNLANPAALEVLAEMGFAGAIVSPELDGETLSLLPQTSRLPLGIVLWGRWPVCISRIRPQVPALDHPFSSPMGEGAYARAIGADYWVFPEWPLDLRSKRSELAAAGYELFVHLHEPLPATVREKKRAGLWNWHAGLR